MTDQLRTLAYTHAGSMLQDRERLEGAAELWRSVGAETHNHIGYNLANAELDLWHLLVRERGYVQALQDDRAHLRDARGLLRRAAYDDTLPLHIRIQALTNLGNSYDSEGRDIDAIAAYDGMLALDPTFGMALGNKGTALVYVAPFAGKHHPTVTAEAVQALDAALADAERIMEFGGTKALEHFRERRANINVSPDFVAHRREHPTGQTRICAGARRTACSCTFPWRVSPKTARNSILSSSGASRSAWTTPSSVAPTT